MFFGTLYDTTGPGTSGAGVVAKMREVPIPSSGMQAGSDGYSESLDFEYGGADVVSAPETHRVYEMTWGVREASGSAGLDIIARYAQKQYGRGLIYFADPYNYGTNLLDPVLASPGLIEQGWRNIFDTTPTYSAVGANSYDQPLRKATWSVTTTANALPTDKRHVRVVPIHPDYTLHLGFSGGATGTAVLRVRPINADGSYAATTDLTLLSETASTRLNATFAGSSYKAVEIYITRTSSATSTLTLASGMAQLWPTGMSPVLTGNWIAGQGNTGCKFGEAALPQEYIFVDNGRSYRLKGMSTTLVEVGSSQRY